LGYSNLKTKKNAFELFFFPPLNNIASAQSRSRRIPPVDGTQSDGRIWPTVPMQFPFSPFPFWGTICSIASGCQDKQPSPLFWLCMAIKLAWFLTDAGPGKGDG